MVDFLNYLMRNMKNAPEPEQFGYFLKAIQEINIPQAWIGNEKVLSLMKVTRSDTTEDVFERLSEARVLEI